jgi:Skp family chaperone for outer membrane proteins
MKKLLFVLLILIISCSSTTKYTRKEIKEMSLHRIVIEAKQAIDEGDRKYAVYLVKEGLLMYPGNDTMFMLLTKLKQD